MNIGNQPTRVRFYERQFLHTRDLTDEQAYHLEMRRRHNLALHTWGIAYGLGLAADGNFLIVQAGVALDGYGRELVLAKAVRAPGPALDPLRDPGPFDVWLDYGLVKQSDGTTANGSCINGKPAEPTRHVEKPAVRLTRTADRSSPNPAEPAEVPVGDLTFSPERPPPDDPGQKWPVFLGKVEYRADPADPLQATSWHIDLSERRYAGLVAEQIVSPVGRGVTPGLEETSQQTLIQNGSGLGRAPYPFAVYVWNTDEPLDEAQPRLAVDSAGGVAFHSEQVTLTGDLVLTGGSALEFQANPIPGTANTEEEAAQDNVQLPWRIYHHFRAAPQQTPPTTTAADNDGYQDELRVAMAGAPQGTNRVVIGYWSDKGKFAPVLTVEDNGNVTVDGNLVVKGGLDPTTRVLTAPAAAAQGGSGSGGTVLGSGDFLDSLDAYINKHPNGQIAVVGELLKPAFQNATVTELLTGNAAKDFAGGIAAAGLTNKLATFAIANAFDELVKQIIDNSAVVQALIKSVLVTDDVAVIRSLAFRTLRAKFVERLANKLLDTEASVHTVQEAMQPYTSALVQNTGTEKSRPRGRAMAATFFDTIDPVTGEVKVGENNEGMDAVARSLAENCRILPSPASGAGTGTAALTPTFPTDSRVAHFISYVKHAPAERQDLSDLRDAIHSLLITL